MKKQILSIAIIGLLGVTAHSQNVFQKAFQRNFSQAYGGVQTADGGFVITGLYQVSATDFDYMAVKINTNQDTIWTKTYGGIGDEECYAMQATNDGGFILAGIDSSSGIGNYNVYLVKADANGDTLWTKSYGGASDDFGQAVQQTADGGYIVAGYTGSFSSDGNNDMYLIKTDASGNLLWSKTYGGAYGDYAMTVKQTTDGGYIMAGLSSSYGISPYGNVNDVLVVKTDASGNLVWSKTYGQAGDDWAYDIIQANDGGYVISGHTNVDSTASLSDAYLIKTDVNGDTLWTKAYGGSNYEKGISLLQISSDSSLVVGGSTYSYGSGASDVLLLKTDKSGNVIFSKAYGGGGNDIAYALYPCSDLGFALYGYTDNFGVSNSSFFIVKASWTGLSGCNQTNYTIATNTTQTQVNTVSPTMATPPTITKQNTFTVVGDSLSPVFICGAVYGIETISHQVAASVYPNPSNGNFTIKLTENPENTQVVVYDLLGRVVLKQALHNLSESITLNVESGLYQLQLMQNNQAVYQTKIIKE